MQEHGAAARRDARAEVVIDLDDEVVEMILARQPISGLVESPFGYHVIQRTE